MSLLVFGVVVGCCDEVESGSESGKQRGGPREPREERESNPIKEYQETINIFLLLRPT